MRDGKKIAFLWVPGYVGISYKSAADSVAKHALEWIISDEYMPRKIEQMKGE